jgi:alcohol dehydrogenase (cytochrome c)
VSMRARLAGAVFVVVAIAVGAAATFAVPAMRWRAAVLGLKVTGELTDISWPELYAMLGPGSRVYLGTLPETRNAYASISNPWAGSADVAAGEVLYRQQCAGCHDAASEGSGAPTLKGRAPRVGSSDWALYRVIREGKPGTAMQPHAYREQDLWQLVAYVQSQIAHPGSATAAAAKGPAQGWDAVTDARLLQPGQDAWLSYSGNYAGWRHTALHEINPDNVGRLQLVWAMQTGSPAPLEVTPIVNGGRMLLTVPPSSLVALDASTGAELWRTQWTLGQPLRLCCDIANRGVAIAGDKVFVGTLDARLLAFRAADGQKLWSTTLADFSQGYSITGAPLIVGDKVIAGVAGSPLGARGFLDAYDAATGQRRWRFWTVPGPGEPGNETWPGDSWKTGGGAPWMTGTFDPELHLLYWGTGNPAPVHNGAVRAGDNLYTDSVVALDPDSGTLRWHFQFTPHDTHDWDATQVPVLVDARVGGQERKLLIAANRNGFYYALDRRTGEFLLARPYIRQTWADGIDEHGRPRARPDATPTRRGVLIYPSTAGGTNWWSPSLDAGLGLLFVPVLDRGMLYFEGESRYEPGQFFLGGSARAVEGQPHETSLAALRVDTGETVWKTPMDSRLDTAAIGGALSTSSGLVFIGDGSFFYAMRSTTGEILWKVRLGSRIKAAPISYVSEGHQRITIAAGSSVFTFGIPPEVR